MLNCSRSRAWLAAALGAAVLAACEDTVTNPAPPFVLPNDYAFVTTTDYTTGAAALVSADTLLTPHCNVATIHSDAVARFFEGRMYIVNRYQADNIQVLDPYSGFNTIKQFSVGNGANPHDIAFLSRSRAFVTRYDTDEMWIVDTNTGRRSGLINFTGLADADNIPEMDHIIRVGNRMFVSIQRLDRSQLLRPPVGTSYLSVFDPYTEQFIDAEPGTSGTQAIALDGANPYSELVLNEDSGLIWVATAGIFGVNDGGLELVDPDALTTSGIVLTESQVGGDISDVVPIDANRGVAVVSDASFQTLLVGFDLSAPASIDTLYAPGAGQFVLADAELSRDGRIFVSDRATANPGLRVFNSTTWSQITTSPVDVCLPPWDIEFGRK